MASDRVGRYNKKCNAISRSTIADVGVAVRHNSQSDKQLPILKQPILSSGSQGLYPSLAEHIIETPLLRETTIYCSVSN